MDLADWFKGFEKGITKLPEAQRETFSVSAARTVCSAARFRFIKTCMNRRLETLTSFSPKPMNCRE